VTSVGVVRPVLQERAAGRGHRGGCGAARRGGGRRHVVVVVGSVVVVMVIGTVVVVLVVVVVEVVGHGVVRGRHSRTNVSRSLSGLVPFGAVALAESRTMAVRLPLCVLRCSGSVNGMKLPQAKPSREAGTAPASLGLTKSFRSPVGGWQADRFGFPPWVGGISVVVHESLSITDSQSCRRPRLKSAPWHEIGGSRGWRTTRVRCPGG